MTRIGAEGEEARQGPEEENREKNIPGQEFGSAECLS